MTTFKKLCKDEITQDYNAKTKNKKKTTLQKRPPLKWTMKTTENQSYNILETFDQS